MDNKNLISLIAAAGLSVASSMPVNAETQVGVGVRYNFGDKVPTLGLFVRDVDFRDIQTNISNSSESTMNADLNGEYNLNNFSGGVDGISDDYTGQDFSVKSYDGQGTLDTNTTTTTTRLSDKISGYGARINFPLSSDWTKPSVELTGIYGNTDVFGQAGVGYDFKRDEITLPASLNYSHVEFGTNLRHPVEDAFIGVNSTGSFKKLDETLIENSMKSETLCSADKNTYAVYDFGDGKLPSTCLNIN